MREAGELARQRHPRQIERAWHRRPEIHLVLSTDVSREVDPPAWGRVEVESQHLERYRHLHDPSVSNALRLHGPHRIPARIDLASFIRDLPVAACARQVRHEDISVGAIAKRIEQYLKVVLQILRKVLLPVVDDDAVGLTIVQIRADVEMLGVEQHADIRALGGRIASVWFALGETGRRTSGFPFRFVKAPVHDDSALDWIRGDGGSGRRPVRATLLGLHREGTAEKQKSKAWMHGRAVYPASASAATEYPTFDGAANACAEKVLQHTVPPTHGHVLA